MGNDVKSLRAELDRVKPCLSCWVSLLPAGSMCAGAAEGLALGSWAGVRTALPGPWGLVWASPCAGGHQRVGEPRAHWAVSLQVSFSRGCGHRGLADARVPAQRVGFVKESCRALGFAGLSRVLDRSCRAVTTATPPVCIHSAVTWGGRRARLGRWWWRAAPRCFLAEKPHFWRLLGSSPLH